MSDLNQTPLHFNKQGKVNQVKIGAETQTKNFMTTFKTCIEVDEAYQKCDHWVSQNSLPIQCTMV